MGFLVAVDGGGTKSEFILSEESGKVIGRVLMGSSNPNDIGFEKTVSVLREGTNKLLNDCKGTKTELLSFFAGLSGGTTGSYKEIIHDKLLQMLPNCQHVANNSDAINALPNGLLTDDGCVVISGTGSVAFSRTKGNIYRCGGWGYLIDKGGSGYDFGRDALYYSLCGLDGREQKTVIRDLLEKEMQKGLAESIGDIYTKGKIYIASLAILVFEAYKMGDQVAKQIISENMKELARVFNTAATYIDERPCKAVLSGSIFKDSDILFEYLVPYLTCEFKFIIPETPPVFGALVEAAEGAGLVVDEAFRGRFKESYYKREGLL